MAVLCPNASLEMLWPLCYCGTHFSSGISSGCLGCDAFGSHVLQNSPQFIVQGVEVWTP